MDTTAANLALASMLGPDRSDVMPSSVTVRLWVGHPDEGGVEQSGPGYAAAVVPMSDWPAYSALTDGSTSALVSFDDATDEWPDSSTHYTVEVSGSVLFVGEFTSPVEVGGAGSFPPVLVTVFFQTEEF